MIRLLSYEALELPIGKGCLYTVGLKLGALTGYAHARLGTDGSFSVPVAVPRETAELGRWYSPEIVGFLQSLKGPRGETLVQHISEALTAAVAERDRRVARARPIVDSNGVSSHKPEPKPEPKRGPRCTCASGFCAKHAPRDPYVDLYDLDPDDFETELADLEQDLFDKDVG